MNKIESENTSRTMSVRKCEHAENHVIYEAKRTFCISLRMQNPARVGEECVRKIACEFAAPIFISGGDFRAILGSKTGPKQ